MYKRDKGVLILRNSDGLGLEHGQSHMNRIGNISYEFGYSEDGIGLGYGQSPKTKAKKIGHGVKAGLCKNLYTVISKKKAVNPIKSKPTFLWILDHGHREATPGKCSPLLEEGKHIKTLTSERIDPLQTEPLPFQLPFPICTIKLLLDGDRWLNLTYESKCLLEQVVDDKKVVKGYKLLEYKVTKDIVDRIISRLSSESYHYHEVRDSEEYLKAHYNEKEENADINSRWIDANLYTKQQPIFISVHTNASGNGEWCKNPKTSGTGIEILYPSKKDFSCKKLKGSAKTNCEREEKEFYAQSFQLAKIFLNHAPNNWKKREIRTGSEAVLRLSRMPAIITENGFHDNIEDCKKLLDYKERDKIAQGHVNAMAEIEKNGFKKSS